MEEWGNFLRLFQQPRQFSLATAEQFGQTTHHTFGEITDADLETTSTEGFSFDDKLWIEPVDPSRDWSAGGDSGSIVFAQETVSGDIKPAVGLHWGGSGVNGVACKIQNVFSALNLTGRKSHSLPCHGC